MIEKIRQLSLSKLKKIVILHPKREGISFANESLGYGVIGNTTDSGPVFPGSSPGTPTQNQRESTIGEFSLILFLLCFNFRSYLRT